MTKLNSVVIGTRGSDLALKQSEIVKSRLLEKFPELHIEITIIKTEGDVNDSSIPLDTIGKGWFTKEIEQSLLSGSVDVAVHSLKDLPEVLLPGLCIAAFPEREDARDVLVSKNNLSLNQLPAGAVIGTDSLRRKIQILHLRNDVTVTSIRGNVPTRLQKLQDGAYDAIVIAAAGLKRLGLENYIAHYFEPEIMTPAPGQGILAIEVRDEDSEIKKIISTINEPSVELAATIERNFSRMVGGGCKEPVGAYAVCVGDKFTLQTMVGDLHDLSIKRSSISGDIKNALELSCELAKQMQE